MGRTSAEVKYRYAAKVYDQIKLQVKKGVRDEWKAHAAAHGESLVGFVSRAVAETIKRDTQEGAHDD